MIIVRCRFRLLWGEETEDLEDNELKHGARQTEHKAEEDLHRNVPNLRIEMMMMMQVHTMINDNNTCTDLVVFKEMADKVHAAGHEEYDLSWHDTVLSIER